MADERKFIELFRSSRSGFTPPHGDMGLSQLAVNFADKKLFTKDDDGRIISLTDRAIIVDRIIRDTTTTFPVIGQAKYLIQRKNSAALRGITSAVLDKMNVLQAHRREVHLMTVSGTATGAGTYEPVPGTRIGYTNGQTAALFATQIASALNALPEVRSAQATGAQVTVGYVDYKPHGLFVNLNANGLRVQNTRQVAAQNRDDRWGVIASDGTNWYVDEVSDNIDNHLVYSKADECLHLTEEDVLTKIPTKFVNTQRLPSISDPSRRVPTEEELISPLQVSVLYGGLRTYSDFEAMDASSNPSITNSNHSVGKTFYITKAGTVSIGATDYNVSIGDSLYKASTGWEHNKAASGGSGKNAATITVTEAAHGFVTGDIVYFENSVNKYRKAQANTANTCGITAFVTRVDANTFEATFSGIVGGLSGLSLTVGETYYLSQSGAGSTQVALPSTGLVKFCYQAIDTDKVVVLPLLAYNAGSGASSGGSGSYTRQEIANLLTNNGASGADYYFAGDGTFRQVDKTKLFGENKQAGQQIGITPEFPSSGGAVTINADINNARIELMGIGISKTDYDVNLGDSAFGNNTLALFYNTGEATAVLRTTNQFFISSVGGTRVKSLRIKPNHMAILLDDDFENWFVIDSDMSKVIDKVIDDGAASGDKVTWSIDEISLRIAGLINDKASGDTDSTWSTAKIASEIGKLLDDSKTQNGLGWSSQKISNEIDRRVAAQRRSLYIEDAMRGSFNAFHIDAYYRGQIQLEKSSDAVTNFSVEWWGSKGCLFRHLYLPNRATLSARDTANPGRYYVEFDGSTNYGFIQPGSGDDAPSYDVPEGVDVLGTVNNTVIFVGRLGALGKSGVQEFQPNNYSAILSDGDDFVLGLSQAGLNLAAKESGGTTEIVSVSITNADLNKDVIVIATMRGGDDIHLAVRGDGINLSGSGGITGNFTPGNSSRIEVGRGSGLNYFQGRMYELVLLNTDIWDDRADYFAHFASKWNITI